MPDARKIDPYDIEALERALNDSATRVSTIWVSFLLFGLYLVIVAGNVTHRQLLLADPIKLPALNVEMPFVGFFFVAPAVFVTFHLYIFIHLLLLARTATAYNEAVNDNLKFAADSARIRNRLTNSLFAQILAGPGHAQNDLISRLLRTVAFVTLVIAPAFILLTFQAKFLPYHSLIVTWMHRILIALDLATILIVWPAAFVAGRQINWRNTLRQRALFVAAILLVSLSWLILSFPDEPHAKYSRYSREFDSAWFDLQWPMEDCEGKSFFSTILPNAFDRLALAQEDFVDDEALAKISATTAAKELAAYQGERARNFRNRNISCGDFSSSDLRRVDFTNALGSGADFSGAELQGATFTNADLNNAKFFFAKLQEASLSGARLHMAKFFSAELPRADLNGSELYGANMQDTWLHGASFFGAKLYGASLENAGLAGADLQGAELYGANLKNAALQGARLALANLQGADLSDASLLGANLFGAQLQGAKLDGADLRLANLTFTTLWRASGGNCESARVVEPQLSPTLGVVFRFDDEVTSSGLSFEGHPYEITAATPETIEALIAKIASEVPEEIDLREALRNRLLTELNPNDDKTQKQAWLTCADNAPREDAYEKDLASLITEIVCTYWPDEPFAAEGIVWAGMSIDDFSYRPYTVNFGRQIANRLLGIGGNPCPISDRLSSKAKRRLRVLAVAAPEKAHEQ